MKLRKRLKRQIVWSVATLFDRVLNLLPRNAAVALGGWIGLAAWSMLPKDRYRINRHLKLALKDQLTESERHQIGRRFFVNSGKNLVDIIRFRKQYTREIKPLITVRGLEHFDSAYRAGKGVIGITGHLGNFELLAAHISALGYEVGVIGREQSDPRIDEWLVGQRAAAGLTNFSTTESPRRILKWLKDGKALGVLIDTDSMRIRGMAVPFLGRPANSPIGQSVLGLRTGAAFVPMVCVRQPRNRYLILIKPAIQYNTDLSGDDLIREVTRKCANALEELVLAYPDQWIWLHNRWHTRPEDAA
jgi:KDO2-lipid IV(A) lauroyltransferase